MKVKVEIKGMQKLMRQLDQLAAEVRGQVLAEAVKAGAEIVRQDAAQRAPRRTGKLAQNIVAEVTEQAPDRVTVAVGPDREGFYGLFIERGHQLVRNKKVVGYVPPRPFLRPAFDANVERVKKAIADELKAALERAARG